MLLFNEKTLFITCDCHCGSTLRLEILDKTLVVTVLQDSFYLRQSDLVWKFKNIINKVLSKKILLMDIYLKDKKDLLEYLYKLYNLLPDSDEVNINYNKFEFEGNDDDGYTILFYSKQNLLDLLFNKEYKAYSISYNKRQFYNFIKKIELKEKKNGKL